MGIVLSPYAAAGMQKSSLLRRFNALDHDKQSEKTSSRNESADSPIESSDTARSFLTTVL